MNTSLTKIVISIDFEMGWGKVQSPEALKDHATYQVRPVVEELLHLFGDLDMRATWATVAHLGLASCDSTDLVAHNKHPRPHYPDVPHDWFSFDPMGEFNQDSIWYAPDLIESILAAENNHEIGSHSFSHMYCGPGFSAENMSAELVQTRQIFSDFGVNVESHVFPRNIVDHLDVLKANGFTSFRGQRPELKQGRFGRLSRAITSSPPVYPVLANEMVSIPATWFAGQVASINAGLSWRKYKYSFDRHVSNASRPGELIHVWFHPYNFSKNSRQTIQRWESMLRRLRARVDEGTAVNQTMGEVAKSLSVT